MLLLDHFHSILFLRFKLDGRRIQVPDLDSVLMLKCLEPHDQ